MSTTEPDPSLSEFDPLVGVAGDQGKADSAPSTSPTDPKLEPTVNASSDPLPSQQDLAQDEGTVPTHTQMTSSTSQAPPTINPAITTPTSQIATAASNDATPTQVTTPTKAEPTPTGIASQGATPTPLGKSPSSPRKKKKKKHKKTKTTNPIAEKSQVVKKTFMSSEQIGTEMNQIDQFLQSLRMGTYDPLSTQTTATTTTTNKSGGTEMGKTQSQSINVDMQANSAPSKSEAQSQSLDKDTQTKTTTTANTGGSQVSQAVQGRSLGMKLIGQFDSSSSSDDSEDSSSDSSDEEGVTPVIIEEGEGSDGGEGESKKSGKYGYPMTKNEINYRDLPPLESCDIPFPEPGAARLIPLGKVSHITEQLVVIQSTPDTPPVDEGTVLWSEEKKSLSVVFEIFGPVKSPYYSVHVHSPDHAHSLGLVPGTVVYVIPGDSELTKYVFTQQLLQQRGSDASWKDDVEVPEELQDFSDDESERKKQKSKREGKRKNPPSNSGPGQQQAEKKQVPRYSQDPKMSAYFPHLNRPQQQQQQVPRPPRAPPTSVIGPPGFRGGGMPYFTPRGFVGFMPPGMHPPPPPAAFRPQGPPGMYGYPPPAHPYPQPPQNFTQPPQPYPQPPQPYPQPPQAYPRPPGPPPSSADPYNQYFP